MTRVNGQRSTVSRNSFRSGRLFRFVVHCSLFTLLACQASTNRPPYDALPSAALAEVELDMPSATRTLAEAVVASAVAVIARVTGPEVPTAVTKG